MSFHFVVVVFALAVVKLRYPLSLQHLAALLPVIIIIVIIIIVSIIICTFCLLPFPLQCCLRVQWWRLLT